MNGTVLLTGASSGIGKSMAGILAKDGWDLIIVGRNRKALDALREDLSDTKVTVIESDLSKDGAAEALFEETERQ
jgi:hypothetical protein